MTVVAADAARHVLDATASAIIVHGGAGTVTGDRFARLQEGCRKAAAAGDAILLAGGSALDAVVAAVRVLEDDPEYNAGTGSALTSDGTVETDAAVMDGATQRVGAVGAVARDRAGRFASATSTGGIAGKRAGRVGDSPVPGAGTWADTQCAISATGDGEAILRVALSKSIAFKVGGGFDLRHAVGEALRELREITGGSAGAIAIDHRGVIGLQLSPTMPIAWIVRGVDASSGDSMGEQIATT